jgi:hypothetical protein
MEPIARQRSSYLPAPIACEGKSMGRPNFLLGVMIGLTVTGLILLVA